MSKKPVMLCILDGFGWVPEQTFGNAIVAASPSVITGTGVGVKNGVGTASAAVPSVLST